MSQNRNNAQQSATISVQTSIKEIENASLTTETLSIVGPAKMGPAFVPQQMQKYEFDEETLNTWENIFGGFEEQNENNLKSPAISRSWLNSEDRQLTYTRVLGIGNGQGLNNGEYEKAGFIVGDSVTSGSVNFGVKGQHSFAVQNGVNGRTYFFGKVFENIDYGGDANSIISPRKGYLQQIGLAQGVTEAAIVTNVVLATSGTTITLQDSVDDNERRIRGLISTQAALSNTNNAISGSQYSDIESPKVYLTGLKNRSKCIISFPDDKEHHDFNADDVNSKPIASLYKGHLCYASFQHDAEFKKNSSARFIVRSVNDTWNDANGAVNYESFESIYTTAKTPWIVSQPINREGLDGNRESIYKKCKKLFRFHSYTDGEGGNNIRIRIIPKRLGNKDKSDDSLAWSVFGIKVYKHISKDNSFAEVLSFEKVDLNPHSEYYICKLFGTEYEYYDIASKKIVSSGDFIKTNNHLRVEVDNDVDDMINPKSLMPSGFMPYPRLNISSASLQDIDDGNNVISNVLQNPVPFVNNFPIKEISDVDNSFDINDDKYWGILFDNVSVRGPATLLIEGINDISDKKFDFDRYKESSIDDIRPYVYYSKYFQDFKPTANNKFWIHDLTDNDTDSTNSFFHLERIRVKKVNEKIVWKIAYYQRDGSAIVPPSSTIGYEYLDIDNDLFVEGEGDSANSNYLNFDLFTYGGFDGVDIFDDYKRDFSEFAVSREYEEEVVGVKEGQIYNAYKLGHDLASDYTNVRVDLLCIPGVSTPDFCKQAVQKAEDLRRYSYLFDVPQYIKHTDSSDFKLQRDSYHYFDVNAEPGERNNTFRDDVNDTPSGNIDNKVVSGTSITINNFIEDAYESRYAVGIMNYCLATSTYLGELKVIEIPGSVAYIMSIINSQSIASPIDSSPRADIPNDFRNADSLINSNFIYSHNGFDSLLNQIKSGNCSINAIGGIQPGTGLKPLSASTKLSNVKSLFRLHHNVRIYLTIVRTLRNILFTQDLSIQGPLLFNNFPSGFAINNIRLNLITVLNAAMTEFLNEGIIKDYILDIKLVEDEKAVEDKFNNVFRGSIGISFFGELDENIVAIDINNLLNDAINFTEDFNTNIIDLRNII